jgi:hypothetical protein
VLFALIADVKRIVMTVSYKLRVSELQLQVRPCRKDARTLCRA